MTKKWIKQSLRIPLYTLYHVKDVEEDNLFGEGLADLWESQHTKDVLNHIVDSLEWAIDNPSYDFNKLLPNIPHSNKEILRYFERVIKIFKEALKIKG